MSFLCTSYILKVQLGKSYISLDLIALEREAELLLNNASECQSVSSAESTQSDSSSAESTQSDSSSAESTLSDSSSAESTQSDSSGDELAITSHEDGEETTVMSKLIEEMNDVCLDIREQSSEHDDVTSIDLH